MRSTTSNGVLFIDYISKLKRDMVVKKFKKLAGDRPPAKMVGEGSAPPGLTSGLIAG